MNKINKLAAFMTVSITMICGVLIFLYLYPQDVHFHAQGIKYRLGSEDPREEGLVEVLFEGKLYKSIGGERRFEGHMDISGEDIPVPTGQRKLSIIITRDGWGAVNYPFVKYKHNGAVESSEIYPYGSLAINKDFSAVTLFVTDQDLLKDKSGTGWNSENALMITAPASSRIEGNRVTNQIANEFLRGMKLE